MTVPDFVKFASTIAAAINVKVRFDEHTVLGALAESNDMGVLTMCLTLWGVMKGARSFSFLFASIPDARAPIVVKTLSKYDLNCTWKRQTFGDKTLVFFVYAKGSKLGEHVSDALAATPDGSTASFTGTAMDGLIGKALGYPTPADASKAWRGSEDHGVMTWSIQGTKLAGKIYSFSLLSGAGKAVRKAEKLWTTAMRKIHPSIACAIHVVKQKYNVPI